MRLPEMKYRDGLTKSTQMQFGGYNHTKGAGDGELWDMENMTSDACPLLSVRKRRGLVRKLEQPVGIGAHNELYWVDGDGFFYGGERVGTVEAGTPKRFAGMGSRVIIWPDKAVYNTATGVFESLEARVSGSGVSFGNGTLYGEEAERNTVTCAGIDFGKFFSAGDAVTISGCTRHPENNKTPIIREISEDGHSIRFYENVLETDGTDEKPVGYTEPGTITFARELPDMDYICVNENRLWGCKGDSIYASKLGDPKNFNVFDGVGTDSFWVDAGSAGDFTACFSFLGYPCFFKERHIYKMYGDLPTNFQMMGGPDLGVMTGCADSLAIAGNNLFYLSIAGVMAYSGGTPTPVGDCLGGQFQQAVGGSDGMKYYVSMIRGDQTRHIFVYDTRLGLWHREDETRAMGWATAGDTLYMLDEDGSVWDITGRTGEAEAPLSWAAEFADFTEGSPDAKGYGKLQVRLELEEHALAEVWLRYDSEDQWRQIGRTMTTERKRTFLLPVIPRRADHYRLKLSGTGGCTIHSIAREYYAGSEYKTVR